MGCNQSTESMQKAQTPAASEPVQEAEEAPQSSKPNLVKYRTLLTGQTIFDASPSKNPSRAESRATSRVSSFHEDARTEQAEASAEQAEASPEQAEASPTEVEETQVEEPALEGEASADASPTVPSFHFDVEQAAQACGVKVDSLILSMKLSTLALSGVDATPEHLKAIADVVCGPEQASQPLQRLLHNIGFQLDRSFAYKGPVQVRGYIAHNEADLVLAFSGFATEDSVDSPLAEIPALAQQQGLASLFACCSGATPHAYEPFLDAFLQSVPDLESVLLPWLQAQEHGRLIVTGHGVGGAVATGALAHLLKTVDFSSSEQSVLFVSTGQPKFGDVSFRKWLDDEVRRLNRTEREAAEGKCTVVRLVHDNDPAPAEPRGSHSLVHVGVPFLLTQAGEMVVGPEVAFAAEGGLASSEEAHANNHPGRYWQLLTAIH